MGGSKRNVMEQQSVIAAPGKQELLLVLGYLEFCE